LTGSSLAKSTTRSAPNSRARAARRGFDGDDQTRTSKPSTGRCHQSDGAVRKDRDRSADGNLAMLGRHKSRRKRVGAVNGFLRRDVGRNRCHIRVGVVHVEVLREDAVLDIGVLPAAECAGRLGRESVLRFFRSPIWRDRPNDHTIAGLESMNLRADGVHDTYGLMSKRQAFSRPDRAAYRMRVGGANGARAWFLRSRHSARQPASVSG
jgi:hypothetical protein